MSKRIFSSEELTELERNPNVAKVSTKSITYAQPFKEQAVSQYEQGMSSRDIFKQAGFNLSVIGRTQPKECLLRWRRQFKENGLAGLIDTRGKTKQARIPRNTETDRLKWLEAEVKYLKAENAFLAQLRAKRAE
jgi:transposase-like protein